MVDAAVAAEARRRSVFPPGLASLALASMLFGCSAVLIRLAYDHGANPAGVVAVRGVATLPWLALLLVPRYRAASRAHLGRLLLMATLVGGSIAVYIVAIDSISPALAALVYYAYPVLVIVGARVLGWTRLDLLTGLAAAAALGGVALAVGVPAGDVSEVGVALALLSGAGYAGYLLLAERTLRNVSPLAAMAVIGGGTGILLLAGSVPAGPELPSDAAGLAIVGLLLLFLVFPHMLVLRGVGQMGGSWGSLVSCLEVVTAIATTAAVVGVELGPGVVIGGVLILVGGVAAPMVAGRRGLVAAVPDVASPAGAAGERPSRDPGRDDRPQNGLP